MKKLVRDIEKTGHSLVTRRDFLSHGLIAFGATMTFSKMGWAQQILDSGCGGGDQKSPYLPFMVFDMAGGGALPANFLVGKEGGADDLLGSYNLLGWDPKESGALNTEFGLPLSAKYSKILQGILTNTTPDARKNFRMGSLLHFAADDTNGNKLNVAALVLKAGARGAYVSNGLGIVDSASGGNSSSIAPNSVYRPTFVRGMTDVIKATSFGGKPFEGFKLSQKKAIAANGVALSQLQIADYEKLPDGKTLADLSKCGYEMSLSFLQGVEGLDPRGDQSAQGVYQINQNTAPDNASVIQAALAMNTIKGFSGPSVWTLGGCDYHDNTQTSGDNKDLEMGVSIGRAVELAHRMKRPFFFHLITDGGCSVSAPGSRKWGGDAGDKSMSVCGFYNPAGPQKMKRNQIGHYTAGQGVERKTLIGNDPSLAGYAALANYLAVCGKLSDFPTLAPGIFTGAGELESVLLFEKNG